MSEFNYTIEGDDGVIGHPTDELTNREYLLVWVDQGLEAGPEVAIYGNPRGLKRLAQILTKIADLDRSQDPKRPHHEPYHCHIRTGLNSRWGDPPSLRIGRVDVYEEPDRLHSGFPPLVPEFSTAAIDDPFSPEEEGVEPGDRGEPPQ